MSKTKPLNAFDECDYRNALNEFLVRSVSYDGDFYVWKKENVSYHHCREDLADAVSKDQIIFLLMKQVNNLTERLNKIQNDSDDWDKARGRGW